MAQPGLIHIYTGDGKGKTTAAVGLACRAAGTGMRVLVAQFLKGRDTGELASLEKLGIPVLRTNALKFVPDMTPEELERCRAEQADCFRTACDLMPDFGMLVLDEVFGAMATGLLSRNDVLALMRGKPEALELVLTGRDAPEAFVSLADYVSDIRCVKHPYERGVPARRGIEF